MAAQVAIQRCSDYNPERLGNAIKKLVDSLRGIESFVKPGQRVLIKPNLLVGKSLEKGFLIFM